MWSTTTTTVAPLDSNVSASANYFIKVGVMPYLIRVFKSVLLSNLLVFLWTRGIISLWDNWKIGFQLLETC